MFVICLNLTISWLTFGSKFVEIRLKIGLNEETCTHRQSDRHEVANAT